MTPAERQTIEQNIKARQDISEIERFITDCYDTPPRFWELLRDYCETKLPPKPPVVDRLPALTESEAIYTEELEMPYGKYAGQAVGEVPCEYLIFLTEGDEFSKRLKRYVKSQRFQDRQGDE